MDQPLDMVIVGAGISGIAMAATLRRRCPWARLALIERRAGLGGTWDLFRYPGVRSDSEMSHFGFSFRPWDRPEAIAEGADILAYLRQVATAEGLDGLIRYSTRVLAADWDAAAALWQVTLALPDGGTQRLAARWLHLATGYYDYDHPHDPALPGIERFAGPVAHPQFWPATLDVAGQRVVVIGSGATAVSLVPALAARGAQVVMLQRTPTWMASGPRHNRLAGTLHRLLPKRWAALLAREWGVRLNHAIFALSRRNPDRLAAMLRRWLRRDLGAAYDPALFEPPYAPWRQRLCLVADGDLFAAIKAGRARVVTGTIDTIEPHAIRLSSGAHLPADVIVTATGLRLQIAGGIAVSIGGKAIDFARHFFYRSAMFSNLPNLSVVFGYLNASWTLRAEANADYIARVLAHMRASGTRMAVPWLPPGNEPRAVAPFDFSSGYLQRAAALMPLSAADHPWKLGQDYLADRRDLRTRPVADGVLRFANPAAPPSPVPTAQEAA